MAVENAFTGVYNMARSRETLAPCGLRACPESPRFTGAGEKCICFQLVAL